MAQGECEQEELAWPWGPGLFCSGVTDRHRPQHAGQKLTVYLCAQKGTQILVVSGVLRVVLGANVRGEMAVEERRIVTNPCLMTHKFSLI